MNKESFLSGYMYKEAEGFDIRNVDPYKIRDMLYSSPIAKQIAAFTRTENVVKGQPIRVTVPWGEDPNVTIGARTAEMSSMLKKKEQANRHMPMLQDSARQMATRWLTPFLGKNADKVPGFLNKFVENLALQKILNGGYNQTLQRMNEFKATPRDLERYAKNVHRNAFSESPRDVETVGRDSGVLSRQSPVAGFESLVPKVKQDAIG